MMANGWHNSVVLRCTGDKPIRVTFEGGDEQIMQPGDALPLQSGEMVTRVEVVAEKHPQVRVPKTLAGHVDPQFE